MERNYYSKRKTCGCFSTSYFVNNFTRTLGNGFTTEQFNFINIRYLRLVKNLEESTRRSAFLYYFFSGIVTIVSILVPSLISIQDKSFVSNATEQDISRHNQIVYWVIWSLSIIITVSNAFIKLLRLDQNYISRTLRLNQLRSEGILFVNNVGEYEDLPNDQRFKLFIRNVEKIKDSQMKQEFIQNSDIEKPSQDILPTRQDRVTRIRMV